MTTDREQERDATPLSARSPEGGDGDLYYETDEIPNLLATVRFMEAFFEAAEDKTEIPSTDLLRLRDIYRDLLNEALKPYAADLALSLVSLENLHKRPER